MAGLIVASLAERGRTLDCEPRLGRLALVRGLSQLATPARPAREKKRTASPSVAGN